MPKRKYTNRAGFYCAKCDTKTTVVSSRGYNFDSAVYRRRYCPTCDVRLTTIETIRIRGDLWVIKKNNSQERFDIDKMTRSMKRAIVASHITADRITRTADGIIELLDRWDNGKRMQANTKVVISSDKIAQLVAESLKAIDKMAYVRFVSVWKDFYLLEQFQRLLDTLETEHLQELESVDSNNAKPRPPIATSRRTSATAASGRRPILPKLATRAPEP